MKYINPNSKKGLVNKFADFICNEITKETKYKTIIQVTYFETFFVINGYTDSDKVLDMFDVQTKFYESNKDLFKKFGLEKINTVDVIKYGSSPKHLNKYSFEFYNTKRPSLKRDVIEFIKEGYSNYESIDYTDKIEVNLNPNYDGTPFLYHTNIENYGVSSEFPYGFSLKTVRGLFYYLEYISNHLFRIINADKINITVTEPLTLDNLENNLIIKSDSQFKDSDLKSLILDVFDFNIQKFLNDNLTDFDLVNEINHQIDERPWLVKDRLKDLILF